MRDGRFRASSGKMPGSRKRQEREERNRMAGRSVGNRHLEDQHVGRAFWQVGLAVEAQPVDIRPERAAESSRVPMRREEKTALVCGTLYLLILRTLALGLRHGQRIARSIQRESED